MGFISGCKSLLIKTIENHICKIHPKVHPSKIDCVVWRVGGNCPALHRRLYFARGRQTRPITAASRLKIHAISQTVGRSESLWRRAYCLSGRFVRTSHLALWRVPSMSTRGRITRRTRSLPTRTPRRRNSRHIRGHPYAPRSSAWMANVNQQGSVAHVPAARELLAAQMMLVIAREADFENFTLQANWPEMTTALDMGILHLWPREKCAAAFPRMSRSIFRRATSARSCRISICSAVNFKPRPLAVSLPAFCALIQFLSVCSTMPSDRAASAMFCPDSTSRTASSLNS